MEGRTYGEVIQQEGEGIASRAEIIAAMNCLMHHLKNEDLAKEWNFLIEQSKGDPNWNVLDWDPREGMCRLEAYVEIAKQMCDASFENLCKLFLSTLKMAFETHYYKEGQLT